MHSIKLNAHVGPDGTLRLDVPIGLANQDVEVVVVVQPRPSEAAGKTPEELGWPPGFLEQTYGSMKDDPIERPPQPDYDVRDELL
jgi:hypothetical protein